MMNVMNHLKISWFPFIYCFRYFPLFYISSQISICSIFFMDMSFNYIKFFYLHLFKYIMHFSISFVRSFTSFHFNDLELRVPNSIYSDGYNLGLLLMQFPISFVRIIASKFFRCVYIYVCSIHACLFVLPLF